jgi:hypothetical protein
VRGEHDRGNRPLMDVVGRPRTDEFALERRLSSRRWTSSKEGHMWSPDPSRPAARALQLLEMPGEEIQTVLQTDNPELVRQYVELHRERMEELQTDRMRMLCRVELVLLRAMTGEATDDGPCSAQGVPGSGLRRFQSSGVRSADPTCQG